MTWTGIDLAHVGISEVHSESGNKLSGFIKFRKVFE